MVAAAVTVIMARTAGLARSEPGVRRCAVAASNSGNVERLVGVLATAEAALDRQAW
jgi:hypothetical protein